MNTSNVYQKHLDLTKRITIEKDLSERKNFTQIAKEISKSSKTVSNEIKRNRVVVYATSWRGRSDHTICPKTSIPPYVCNACPLRKACHKTKYYYYAHDAQGKYEKILSNSRKGIDMTSTEFKELNDIVSEVLMIL